VAVDHHLVMKPSSTNRRPPGPLATLRKLKVSPEQTLGWVHSTPSSQESTEEHFLLTSPLIGLIES